MSKPPKITHFYRMNWKWRLVVDHLKYAVTLKYYLVLHSFQKTFTLGFKKASLLIFEGYVNEIWLLIISMFPEPVKLIFVKKLSTSVLIYVLKKINDDNPSPIASISALVWKLSMSASPKDSTDSFNELKNRYWLRTIYDVL